MPTIAQAITEGAQLLQAAGVERERLTAGLLLGHVLDLDRTHLLTTPEQQVEQARYNHYLSLIERRALGEPLQYLTGHQEFYGLDFIVTPDVLIPRPETEFLIERVLKAVAELKLESPLIVDVGTGSGCIAVTLAKELPGAQLIATDASSGALAVARTNAERHSNLDRIEFLEGDLLTPLAGRQVGGGADLVVSNPPYVTEDCRETLQREVRDWEPKAALFGGADGLAFYRRLFADGANYLKSTGYLVVEIGYGQLDSITDLARRSSWEPVDVISDLQGIPRTLTLRKVLENR